MCYALPVTVSAPRSSDPGITCEFTCNSFNLIFNENYYYFWKVIIYHRAFLSVARYSITTKSYFRADICDALVHIQPIRHILLSGHSSSSIYFSIRTDTYIKTHGSIKRASSSTTRTYSSPGAVAHYGCRVLTDAGWQRVFLGPGAVHLTHLCRTEFLESLITPFQVAACVDWHHQMTSTSVVVECSSYHRQWSAKTAWKYRMMTELFKEPNV